MRLQPDKPKILIVTAVDLERKAVLEGIDKAKHVDVLIGGVGPIDSAVNTTLALSNQQYDIVINMGIGGGFRGRTEIGSVVVASQLIAADFGVETPTGFHFADTFQLGSAKIAVEHGLRERMVNALKRAGLKVDTGPILTVSTVTGTHSTAIEMQKRVPDAMAEAMEGFGVAVAARKMQVPVLEIRAISNMVGQRDKASWRIEDALASLTKTSRRLMEVWQ